HAIVTYGQLGDIIHNIARYAKEQGLQRGDTVLLGIEDVVGHPLFILGLAKAGIVTISSRSPEMPPNLKVAAILTDVDGFSSTKARVIRVGAAWTAGDGTAAEEDVLQNQGDEICRIIFTSGTTGEPKAIALSHKTLMERASQRDFVAGNLLPAELRTCVDLGFPTSIGHSHLIYALSRGGMVVLPGSSYEHVLNACDFYQVGSWVGSPAGLAKLLECYEDSNARRCNFQVLMTVGSLLTKPLSERVRKRMCANLISCYGSSETHTVATAPAYMIAETLGAVGFLTPGMSVQAVDDNDRPLAAGSEGIIRIRGPYNVAEYIGDKNATAEAFRDGWFYPGDIGKLTRDRMLIITGRLKSVMNIGGDKIKPESIEAVLLAFPGITQAGVAGFPNQFGIEEIRAAFSSVGGVNDAELMKFCQGSLPPTFVPRRFVRVDAIPLNDSGKVDRRRLTEILESGMPRTVPDKVLQ
ncbi:MAG: class I adenylate-forming enzyme family protein, partial [Burkholderiaceae bacterium]